MKKMVLIVVALALILAIGVPQRAQAHGNGWWIPGAFFGGLLFGAAIARPYPYYYAPPPVYAYPPPPVYAYPPPAYAYPPQPRGYVYQSPSPPPPPAPRAEAPQTTARGEWVTVPGQWVGDKYVPSHKAWVPEK